MNLHPSTFEYLKPTDQQLDEMANMHRLTKAYAEAVETYVPQGADRTYALRKLRELAMWLNVAIMRKADGSPRAP